MNDLTTGNIESRLGDVGFELEFKPSPKNLKLNNILSKASYGSKPCTYFMWNAYLLSSTGSRKSMSMHSSMSLQYEQE